MRGGLFAKPWGVESAAARVEESGSAWMVVVGCVREREMGGGERDQVRWRKKRGCTILSSNLSH